MHVSYREYIKYVCVYQYTNITKNWYKHTQGWINNRSYQIQVCKIFDIAQKKYTDMHNMHKLINSHVCIKR